MNIKRVLFGVWLISAILFVDHIIESNLSTVLTEIDEYYAQQSKKPDAFYVACKVARGKEGTDYVIPDRELPSAVHELYPALFPCLYHSRKRVRELYPEYSKLSDNELGETLASGTDIAWVTDPLPLPNPWAHVLRLLRYALGIPLFVFVAGFALCRALPDPV